MLSPDLLANRAGRMTAAQRLRLLGGQVRVASLLVFGLLGVAVVGPNLGTAFAEDVVLGVAGSIFVAVCALTAIGCGYTAATRLADVVAGTVGEAAGTPHVDRIPLPPRWRRGPYRETLTREYAYRMQVGGRSFALSGPAAEVLLRHDSDIRVFYGRYSGELLSVDRVGP